MTFLPIVERELRAAAHRRSTFRARLVGVLLASAVCVVFLLGWGSGAGTSTGRAMFWWLSGLLLYLGVIEGLRGASDALSAERREGTLGLLFLTDLRAHDVVLGKAAASSLQRFLALLSVLPLLVLAVPAGGVTGGEVGRMVLALLNALALATAIGLMVSAFSREALRSFFGAAGLFAFLAFAPMGAAQLAQWTRNVGLAASLEAASPLTAFNAAADGAYRASAARYWMSLLSGQLTAWACLVVACWQAGRSFQERATRAPSSTVTQRRTSERRRHEQRPLLDTDPVLWLQTRGQRNGWLGWLVATALVLGSAAALARNPMLEAAFLPVAMFAGLLLRWGIKVGLTIQVTQGFAALRRPEGADLLLCTPLSERDVLRGYARAAVQQWRGPVLLTLAIESVVLVPLALGLPTGARLADNPGPFYALAVVGGFLLDLAALYWAGAWMAVQSGRANSAALRALLMVQVLPSLVCCGFPILTDLLFLLWGRSRLRRGFRSLLSQGEGQGRAAGRGWPFRGAASR